MRVRDQAKTRKNRIFRRGSEALQEAYVNGNISARKADVLLHLPAEESAKALAAILDKQAKIVARSAVATEVIRKHLLLGRRDLVMLEADLRLALCNR